MFFSFDLTPDYESMLILEQRQCMCISQKKTFKHWFHHVYHLELVNEYPLEEDGQQQQMQSIIEEQQWYKQQQGRQIQEQI